LDCEVFTSEKELQGIRVCGEAAHTDMPDFAVGFLEDALAISGGTFITTLMANVR